jgi:hypothetical protein
VLFAAGFVGPIGDLSGVEPVGAALVVELVDVFGVVAAHGLPLRGAEEKELHFRPTKFPLILLAGYNGRTLREARQLSSAQGKRRNREKPQRVEVDRSHQHPPGHV